MITPDLHHQLATLTLDALSAHVAVLNADGVILLVNAAWRSFAQANAAEVSRVTEGANYLEVCDAAEGRDSQGAIAFAQGIRDVLKGHRNNFELEYPCSSLRETRWFLGRITRFVESGVAGVVIAHENITERKLAEIARSESQVNLRCFFETTLDMVLVWGFDGSVLHSNNVLRQRLGYSEEELSALHVLELRPSIGTKPTAGIFASVGDIPAQGSPLQLAAKDGSLVEVNTRVWPGEWDGKECIFWLSQDLTVAQEVQHRFESLFRRNPCPMTVTSLPDQIITDVNDAWLTALGYDYDEIIGKTSHELGLFPEIPIRDRAIELLNKSGRFHDMEMPIRTKSGKMLSGLCSGEMLQHMGKRYFLVVMIDITERKQAEANLRESRGQLDLVLDSAGMGLWQWDIINDRRHYDDRTCRLLGIDPEKFRGAPEEFFNSINTLDRDRIKAALTSVTEDNAPYNVEYMVTWPDGSDHFIAARGRLFRDEQGKPVRLDGIAWDQTQRIRAERALIESEGRFRQLSDIFPETLFEANLDGRITYANARGLQAFGVTEDDIDNGINMLDFVVTDDHQKVDSTVKARIDGASGGFTEYRALRRNGEAFDALAYSGPKREMNRITGIRGFILDISERKQAEEELLRTNRQLADATARANQLATQAELANAAKSEFLAKMSHEIRTPMNGVIGMTGLLLDSDLTTEQRQFAESARSSAESLLALLNDILDFSKIEAGKLTLECLDFDVRSVFDDVARIMGLSAEKKNLDLICSVSDKVPAVLRGDPGRVRQVLFNLVGNAVKFTTGGEILVRAKVQSETQSGLLLHFSVRDTGIGIPEHKLNLLFEKFTQVDASTTRHYGGSGLGLAISKQLAALMGGQIGVQSVQGLGSEFWFTAMLEIPHVPLMTSQSSAPRLAASKSGKLSLRVLVAEDNTTNQQVALGILRKLGHQADAVANGYEVLDTLRHVPYDLVLMDVQMPEMDGLDATRRVRSTTDEVLNRSIPIIAMTAHAMQGDREKCLDAGMDDYISKPVTPLALSLVLERWISQLGKADTKATHTQQAPPESTPIFDEKSLLGRLMGDRQLAQIILAGFLGDIPQQIAILEAFLDKGDAPSVQRQAHSIRGAAAAVGGETLVCWAAELEQAGQRGDLERIAGAIGELHNRFEQLEKAIKMSCLLDTTEDLSQ